MYFVALATDYDGTLAEHGRVDAPTLEALDRFKASGRRLILVTGRELPDLQAVFPELDRFDAVVAENGALLYLPQTAEERPVAPEPPAAFVAALRACWASTRRPCPKADPGDRQLLFWDRRRGAATLIEPISPRQAHKRHTRKYAEGTLGEDKSFYFRGPEEALNLRAQNLMMFLQIAEGVDDATWLHHLRRGDYARSRTKSSPTRSRNSRTATPRPAVPGCARR